MTTFTISREQWEFLRRAAEDRAAAEGGRPDASEVLREILASEMIESLEGGRVLVETGEGLSPLHAVARDRQLPELLGIKGAPPMAPDEFRRIRHELGLTQKDMARKLGRDVMTLSRWERGTSRIKPAVAFRVRHMAREARKGSR